MVATNQRNVRNSLWTSLAKRIQIAQVAQSDSRHGSVRKYIHSGSDPTLSSIYPGICGRALRVEGILRKGRPGIFAKVFPAIAAKQSPALQWAIKTFGLARKFPRLFKSGIYEKSCTSSAGFTFEYQKVMVTRARLNIVSCLLRDSLKLVAQKPLHTALTVTTQDMAASQLI